MAKSPQQKKKAAKKTAARPHHHGDLKQTLVRVAIEYLKEGTADDMSLRELARRAGVSQAAPYRHFSDKDHLLAMIAADGFHKLGDFIKDAMESHPDKVEEQFFASCRGYLQMALEYPEHFKLITSSAVSQEYFFQTRELYLAAQRSFYFLVRMIVNCQKQKLIGQGCPVRRALHCWSTVHGFSALYSLGRLGWLGVNPESAAAALKGLMLGLFLSHKPDDSELRYPFLPRPSPIPQSVLLEVGLDLNDIPSGSVQTFDDQKEWPDLRAMTADVGNQSQRS